MTKKSIANMLKDIDKLGKIFVIHMKNKMLVYLVWRKLLQINMNKTNNPITYRNMSRDHEQRIKDKQFKYEKRCSQPV